jgi:hypothetical protein
LPDSTHHNIHLYKEIYMIYNIYTYIYISFVHICILCYTFFYFSPFLTSLYFLGKYLMGELDFLMLLPSVPFERESSRIPVILLLNGHLRTSVIGLIPNFLPPTVTFVLSTKYNNFFYQYYTVDDLVKFNNLMLNQKLIHQQCS